MHSPGHVDHRHCLHERQLNVGHEKQSSKREVNLPGHERSERRVGSVLLPGPLASCHSQHSALPPALPLLSAAVQHHWHFKHAER